MKKLLLGLALAGITSVSSHAISVWIDKDSVDVVLLPGASTSGTFNIAAGDGSGTPDIAGFVPGTDFVNSATASFDVFFEAGNVLSLITASYDLGSGDQTGSGAGIFTFTMGTGPGGANAAVLLDLNADGILTYTIKNTSATQTIEVDTAGLVAIGNLQSVPDGGSTVMLLGSTLMGMAALARRKK